MSEWITDRLPTWQDADKDCEVLAPYKPDTSPEDDDHGVGVYVHYTVIVPGQPWWSPNAAATQGNVEMPLGSYYPLKGPLSSYCQPPAPAPARVVTALCSHEGRLYAACDDGSFWEATDSKRCGWLRRDQIPQPEAPDA